MSMTKEEAEKYETRLTTTFDALKRINTYEGWVRTSIPIGIGLGELRCICELHVNDDAMITLLARWREGARRTFRDTFKVTFGGTKRWLRESLLDIPDKILFLVIDSNGCPVGHMGFARSLNNDCILNFDNLIRGVPRSAPEIMAEGAKALFAWALDTIKPQAIMSQPVMERNTYSVKFHKHIGFKVVSKRVQGEGEREPGECELALIYQPSMGAVGDF